jgi:hypothetical protein
MSEFYELGSAPSRSTADGSCPLTQPDNAKTAVQSEEIWYLRKTYSNTHSLTSMRISTYSDLHLEFGSGWMLPPAVLGDVMILAGDIVTLRDYGIMSRSTRFCGSGRTQSSM